MNAQFLGLWHHILDVLPVCVLMAKLTLKLRQFLYFKVNSGEVAQETCKQVAVK